MRFDTVTRGMRSKYKQRQACCHHDEPRSSSHNGIEVHASCRAWRWRLSMCFDDTPPQECHSQSQRVQQVVPVGCREAARRAYIRRHPPAPRRAGGRGAGHRGYSGCRGPVWGAFFTDPTAQAARCLAHGSLRGDRLGADPAAISVAYLSIWRTDTLFLPQVARRTLASS